MLCQLMSFHESLAARAVGKPVTDSSLSGDFVLPGVKANLSHMCQSHLHETD